MPHLSMGHISGQNDIIHIFITAQKNSGNYMFDKDNRINFILRIIRFKAIHL